MVCSKCGAYCSGESGFCPVCDTPLSELPKREAPKGRHFAPVLIMILMFAFGFFVYLRTATPVPRSETPWFSVTDGVLSFNESKYTEGPELVIPNSVDGQTVTALAEGCFQGCGKLTYIVLSDSVTSVGKDCFSRCQGLRGVKLSPNVQSIGANAFYRCKDLEAVYIPGSVKTVGKDALFGCGSLAHIFYGGSYEDWDALYPQGILPNTHIYPIDDTNPQSFQMPQT